MDTFIVQRPDYNIFEWMSVMFSVQIAHFQTVKASSTNM